MNIDSIINNFFTKAADFAESIVFYSVSFDISVADGTSTHSLPIILVWLLAAALFFTVYLGFVNIRCFKHAIDVVRGLHDGKRDNGQIGRFQALTTALSGTVGLGNIAGVAVAVSIGGPGAAIWMIIIGFFSMATKFAEVTLGVKYREIKTKGGTKHLSGGPMYYIKAAFENRDMPHAGTVMAGIFAIACMAGALGGGNIFQSNQMYQQAVNVTGGDASWLVGKGWLFGAVLAFLVGAVIIGGLQSIANVASKLVPSMAALYLGISFIVIAMSWETVPDALWLMVNSAFNIEAGLGGVIGAILVGVQRAVFSNEAGLGSASIVHAAAKVKRPVSQGMVGMLGPFVDTIIICFTTALVIIVSGVYETGNGVEGIELTSRALETGSPMFPYLLTIAVFLFAYSTIITWSYYGTKCLTYLTGYSAQKELAFKIFYCSFIIVGTSTELGNVVRFADAMFLTMAFPNIIGLYLCAPELKKDLNIYLQDLKAKGKKMIC